MANRAIPSDVYRHFGAYERVRHTLLAEPDNSRLDRTLAYWVLPSDRRLPVAFLGRTLRDITSCSLEELLETPGVGQKKIGGLLTLLKRATKSGNAEDDFGMTAAGERRRRRTKGKAAFDPLSVSEELWSLWRDTVRRCDVGHYTLGRLAPTLQLLPTVIWHTPLSEYIDLTLDEIRSLKTHGEKRVHAILEVFCGVHEALATSTIQEHFEITLVPKFISPIAEWIIAVLDGDGNTPAAKALHENVATSLVKQIEIDLGKQVAKLSSARVSLSASAPTVRTQAKRLGVTRARVYQLLDDCAKVMDVRWPQGRWLLAPLGSRIAIEEDVEALAMFRSICDLFFPLEKGALEAAAATV